MRWIKRQIRLRRLQHIVQRNGTFSSSSFRQAHQVGCGQMPRRRGKHAGARNIVERTRDQVKIREHITHQRMLEYRQLRDDKRNLAQRQLFHKMIAMRVLSVQHREVPPAAPGGVQTLQLVRNPCGFVLGSLQLDNANLFALRLVRLQNLFREFRAHLVHRNGLRRHAQYVGSRAVVVHQRDTVRRGVLAFFPICETLQKQFEAAERRPTEAIDCLIVVANHHDVAAIRAQQMK